MSPNNHLLLFIKYKMILMNTIPQNIVAILSVYVSKEISESEFFTLKAWISESAENEKAFSDYLLFYKKSRRIVFAANIDKDKAWNAIVSQLETPLESVVAVEKPESKATVWTHL